MPAFSLPDEQTTEALGATLAERLKPGDVVGLKGELGAGKTTLARAILRAAAGDPEEGTGAPSGPSDPAGPFVGLAALLALGGGR